MKIKYIIPALIIISFAFGSLIFNKNRNEKNRPLNPVDPGGENFQGEVTHDDNGDDLPDFSFTITTYQDTNLIRIDITGVPEDIVELMAVSLNSPISSAPWRNFAETVILENSEGYSNLTVRVKLRFIDGRESELRESLTVTRQKDIELKPFGWDIFVTSHNTLRITIQGVDADDAAGVYVRLNDTNFTPADMLPFAEVVNASVSNNYGSNTVYVKLLYLNGVESPVFSASFAFDTIYVSTDGYDTNDGFSPLTPFRNFKKAMDKAAETGVTNIFLTGGDYIRGAGIEPAAVSINAITIDKDGLVIRGGWDQTFTSQVSYTRMIGGDILGRVLGIEDCSGIFVERLLITGGYLITDRGAGLIISGLQDSVITNCVITENLVGAVNGFGGGVYVEHSTNNQLYLTVCSNRFNDASSIGGGMFLSNVSDILIGGENFANDHVGVYCIGSRIGISGRNFENEFHGIMYIGDFSEISAEVTANGMEGIVITGGYSRISGMIHANFSNGINISGGSNSIDAQVFSNGYYGIKLDGTSNYIDGAVYANSSTGIRMQYGFNNIFDVQVLGNGNLGYYFVDCTNSIFNGAIGGNSDWGVYIYCNLYYAIDNTFNGDVYSNGLTSMISGDDGIRIEGARGNVFNGNFFGNDDYGLDLRWPSQDNVINGDFYNNGDSGIYMANDYGTVNSRIYSNGGGGVYINGDYNVFTSNAAIFHNTATSSPGGIEISVSDYNIFECDIYSNSTSSSGYAGGVYMSGSDNNTFSGDIYGNQSGGYAGGLYIRSSSWDNLFTGDIYDNTSALWGGGIYMDSSHNNIFSNISVYNNVSGRDGGGIYLYGGNNNYFGYGTVFTSNQAAWTGGGFYVDTSGPVYIVDCFLTNNVSTSVDSVIGIWTGGSLYLSNCVIGGQPGASAYGIYEEADIAGHVMYNNTFITNCLGNLYGDFGGDTLGITEIAEFNTTTIKHDASDSSGNIVITQ